MRFDLRDLRIRIRDFKLYNFSFFGFTRFFSLTILSICLNNGLTACLIFGLPSVAEALVFRCIKATGEVEFSDKPCAENGGEQSFLPYRYQKTDPKSKEISANHNPDKLYKQQISMRGQAEILAGLDRKEERLRLRAEKKHQKEEAAAKRRKIRCERLDEKIVKLERQLQQGKKIKTYQRLQAELEHCELMKKRYCSSSGS